MRPLPFLIASGILLPLATHAWTLEKGVMTCYVSPDGDDAADGNAPNQRGTSAPFATLEHAVEAAKLQAKAAPTPLAIRLTGGYFELPRTIQLRDWKAENPLLITSHENESPILSAAILLRGWKNVGSNRWEITLPDVATGEWNFQQLSYNGERRYRPSLPEDGYFLIDREIPPTPKAGGDANDIFGYAAGDFDPNWVNRADLELETFHVWTMSRMRIGAVDEAARTLTFNGRTRSKNYILNQGGRYRVINVKEALERAGQWYLDRPTGVLTYLAKPGEDPNRDMVLAPRLERVLQMENVQNITFRGLHFTGTNVVLDPDGYSSRQGEVGISSAVEVRHARGLRFVNCQFENLGGWAVDFGIAVHDSELSACRIRDLGAGGIKIGTTEIPANAEEITSDNRIEDCVISSGGRVYNSALGVWIGHAARNRVAWNEIGDFYYTGVSVGWTWGYGPSVAHGNIIERNHIHHIGQDILSDMGAIYTLGISPGTRLIGNRIHDVSAFNYGGWGIYFDEGTTHVEARDNVVYDCDYAPFDQHYGTLSRVENNIFAMGRVGQIRRTRGDNDKHGDPAQRDKISFSLKHNIFYWEDDAPLLLSNWDGNNFVLDSNLYWSTTGLPMRFPGNRTLEEWRKSTNQDLKSIVCDPQFEAPAKGDFRLKNLEAARQIGFVPFPMNVGSRVLPALGDMPPRAFPAASDANYWKLDPEDQPAGGAPRVKENASFNHIKVAGGTASSGSKSLAFDPTKHSEIIARAGVDVRKGNVTSSFSLRLGEGAKWAHVWHGSDATQGPNLSVDNGKLNANGKFVTALPQDVWLKFRMTCPLGLSHTGNYQLVITIPGQPEAAKFDLPFASGNAFGEASSWNFETSAPEKGDPSTSPLVWMDEIAIGPNLTN